MSDPATARKEYEHWLVTLGEGDKVLIKQSTGFGVNSRWRLETVKRVTPTQVVVTGPGTLPHKYWTKPGPRAGRRVGDTDSFLTPSPLYQITPQRMKELRDDRIKEDFDREVCRAEDLTLAQMEAALQAVRNTL